MDNLLTWVLNPHVKENSEVMMRIKREEREEVDGAQEGEYRKSPHLIHSCPKARLFLP